MMHRKASWTQHVWLLFPVIVLFAWLGTRGLNEPDEGRYAEIGREMAETGQYLIPHLNGFEHFQKPPLLYWLTALNIHLFGVNEWAARLPSALAALGVIVLTFQLGKKLAGREQGIVAATILTASVGFFALARLLTPDMLLTFWITSAITAFIHRRPWLFFISMGLGFLTKGPMAMVVPLFAAFGWQFFASEATEKIHVPWFRGIFLTVCIALSWFVALSVWQPDLFDYFWRYELLQRFASAKHGRSQPFWFFIPVLIGGFLPWSFLLMKHAGTFWKNLRQGTFTPKRGFLLGWILPPFLILSLSGSKLPTYILPLLPPLAIVTAQLAFSKHPRKVWYWAGPASVCYLAAILWIGNADAILKQQASIRPIAAFLKRQPDFPEARIFACEVRAHGLEFYLQRLVSVTRSEAEIVLPTTELQTSRLFRSPQSCETYFEMSGPAYGIVRSARAGKTFPLDQWTILKRSGDFVLLGNKETNVNR